MRAILNVWPIISECNLRIADESVEKEKITRIFYDVTYRWLTDRREKNNYGIFSEKIEPRTVSVSGEGIMPCREESVLRHR